MAARVRRRFPPRSPLRVIAIFFFRAGGPAGASARALRRSDQSGARHRVGGGAAQRIFARFARPPPPTLR
eukprot:129430-Pyramimonas_sp.AAC.1